MQSHCHGFISEQATFFWHGCGNAIKLYVVHTSLNAVLMISVGVELHLLEQCGDLWQCVKSIERASADASVRLHASTG